LIKQQNTTLQRGKTNRLNLLSHGPTTFICRALQHHNSPAD